MNDLRLFVFGLFFIFGGITSLNDVLIPKLKELFVLNYAEAMLVQSAFFAAYFIFSLPAAQIVQRVGYMRGAAVGLLTMTAGCLLFIPAASSAMFIHFLGALFILAVGITMVQVVANPLISMLGPQQTVHSRLTFAQAFNSLGTTIFPYVGATLILGGLDKLAPDDPGYRTAEITSVMNAYLGLALVLAVLSGLVWLARRRLKEERIEVPSVFSGLDLLRRPRFGFGAACIFLYVGAEVAIGSVLINFLERPDIWGIDALGAGRHVAYYWGGAMVGRFIGSWFLRQFAPGWVLGISALAGIVLLIFASVAGGTPAGWAVLAVGLFNSIMFPTIFSLACEGLGSRAAEGSGLICVMIVGGAVIPPLTGFAADIVGLRAALIVPAICYAGILAYGLKTRSGTKAQVA